MHNLNWKIEDLIGTTDRIFARKDVPDVSARVEHDQADMQLN